MKQLLIVILLFLCSLSGYSAIYERSNQNGDTVYSDVPASNSQPIHLPRANATISTPSSATPSASTPTPSQGFTPTSLPTTERKPYVLFVMTDPADQETFQNQRDIPLKIEVKPSLQPGDTIQLFLDGKPIGEASADLNQLALHQLDRGEHHISAALMDSNGHLLKKTDPITIFIHYSAIPTGSGAVPGSAKTAP